MDKMTSNTLALLGRGPVEAGGRLECEVANRLRLGSNSPTIEKVKKTILKLETDGIVVVGRSGSVLRSMALVPKSKIPTNEIKEVEVVKETQVTPAATEVVEEKSSDRVPTPKVKANDQDLRCEQLTLALWALQKAAGSEGFFIGASARIIATDLEISEQSATTLNTTLLQLGLRRTDRTNRKKPVHYIDMETKEVTQEMVDALVVASEEVTVKAEPVFVEPVLPVQTEQSLLSVEEQLADVILGLERKVESLEGALGRANDGLVKEMARYDSAANESARVISGLTDDLQAANRTIADLRTQLAALQGPPSERIQSLLDKYRPAADPQS